MAITEAIVVTLINFQDLDYGRIIGFVFAVLVGSGVRLGFKSRRIKISWSQVITVIASATLIGYWVDIWATSKGFIEMRGAMVSASALIAESLLSYFFKNDEGIWDDLRKVAMNLLSKKAGGDLENNKKVEENDIDDDTTTY